MSVILTHKLSFFLANIAVLFSINMMFKSKVLYTFLLSVFFWSCGSDNHFLPANEPLTAGREFMESCIKNNFDKASFYMLPDAENIQLLKKINSQFQTLSDAKKKQLSESSIIILDVSYITQSEVVINYKYSYDGFARKIKVILQPNGYWLVDFKYSNNGNL